MAAVQSGFPDLDAALTVSRVQVVSNVEIDTIKGALQWLFDELQKQQQPASSGDATSLQARLDDLRKLNDEQKTLVAALQEQQVSCMPSNEATYASPMSLDAVDNAETSIHAKF